MDYIFEILGLAVVVILKRKEFAQFFEELKEGRKSETHEEEEDGNKNSEKDSKEE